MHDDAFAKSRTEQRDFQLIRGWDRITIDR